MSVDRLQEPLAAVSLYNVSRLYASRQRLIELAELEHRCIHEKLGVSVLAGRLGRLTSDKPWPPTFFVEVCQGKPLLPPRTKCITERIQGRHIWVSTSSKSDCNNPQRAFSSYSSRHVKQQIIALLVQPKDVSGDTAPSIVVRPCLQCWLCLPARDLSRHM